MHSVLLLSDSPLKLEAVKKLFPPDQYIITHIDSDVSNLPRKPFNSKLF